MTQLRNDWGYIRRHTLVPLITAMIAIVAVAIALFLRSQQVELHAQFSANHSVVQEDFDALVDRRRIVERYHRRYQQFSELGFVGLESRLEWVETLRSTAGILTLPRVSYEIQPQLNVIAPVESALAGDELRINVSTLELEMNLVHELDLLKFIDKLQKNAPGLIKVDRCTLDWQSESGAKLAAVANILAQCSINIYSVITSDVRNGKSS